MKKVLASFLLCLLAHAGIIAGTLKGKITDSKGETLPFATVFVQGTTIGSSANADGLYQLSLQPGTYTVSCQYIGFRQASFPVTILDNEVIVHDFTLQDQQLQMKEHIVKASEDPARYIMRKVIGRRKFHLNQVEAFQADIYLKAVLKTRQTPAKVLGQKVDDGEMGLDTNGKGILYLLEEVATYYAQDNKKRTVIHSVRESGDPGGVGTSQFPEVISFYQNNVQISNRINPRGFISPLNDFAFNFYDFKLEGDFKEGGYTIYKIRVTPKRLYEPLFTGDIYIVDEDWSLHSLNLMVTKKSNAELVDTMQIAQVYLPLKKDIWVIKQQVLFPTIKIFGFDLTGDFVTVYDNQKVNEAVPDTVFDKKVVSEYDKKANKKDTSYWTDVRPIPLLEDEQKDYIKKDSLRILFESPEYKDSIRRVGNKPNAMSAIVNGYDYTGKGSHFTLHTNALLTGLVNYNTIEGVNVAPKFFLGYEIDSFSRLYGAVAMRYGFENRHFNSIGKVNYLHGKRGWLGNYWSVGVEAGKYVFQFNPHNPLSGLYNSISTLFYRKNYLKLYERWEGKIMFLKDYGTGFKWGGDIGFQKRMPLYNVSDFSFAKSDIGGFTENIPSEFKSYKWEPHNATLARLWVSYQPGFTYTRYPDFMMAHKSKYPVFTLTYEKGIPDILESKVDFDKWRFDIRDDVGLKLLGSLSYHLATGGFLNTKYVSIPDLNHLNGNQLTLAAPYLESFQLAPYYTYSNHASLYGEGHVEWYLKGFLTNKIPLFRQLRWYAVTGGNAYYVNKDLYYMEAFVGIDNLGYDKLRIFRLDFVQSWNNLHQTFSGIRIGINTSSLIRIDLDDREGEW